MANVHIFITRPAARGRLPRILVTEEVMMNQSLRSLTGCAGIGLRPEHYVEFIESRPSVGFIEAHSENYFGRGGKPLHFLKLARQSHPLSLHGVGLSIGSVDPLSEPHLARLRELIDMLDPALVSDHLCWSSVGGIHANDLLPLPFTEEALSHVVVRVQQVQERLRRRILLENVSSYLEFVASAIPEWEFLAEVARRSGCGILLDVNNIFVSAHNHGFDARHYLQAIPRQAVEEIHLAGFTRNLVGGGAEILIDTHSAPVADAVWALYAAALERFGPVPTLVEWDADMPALAALVAEAAKAEAMMELRHACAA
ncbi:MNIO family bufferin maturase [Variovorax sp. LjRoot84]|uniref:MNIO family bufferin maturase n=2 Tax=unclassified Variovorax TaxID=663243 RepID=UPI003F50F2F2